MLKKLRQFWKWLWSSNSLLSWVISFLLAFIIVRFVFYPALGLLLGTSIPLVVIESGSMEHFGTFDEWWMAQENSYEDFDITRNETENWPFKNGLYQGDIAIIKKRDFGSIKIGEVIVFKSPSGSKSIIHRVVVKRDDFLETKGDANVAQIGSEQRIEPEQVEGVAVLRIPYIGWIKLVLVESIAGFRSWLAEIG